MLTAAPDQQSIVRNGISVLASTKKHIVMLRPNSRLVGANDRPAFTIVVKNQGRTPETLLESSVRASQQIGNKTVPVRVFSHDELVQEEQTRQKIKTVGVALSAMSRSLNASNAGNVHTAGTVLSHNPYGTSIGTFTATTHDPVRAQIAQDAARRQTNDEIAQVREQGAANIQALEQTILKDNTVMPGEWIGGTVVLAPPAKRESGGSAYAISVSFAGEQHTFSVSHIER